MTEKQNAAFLPVGNGRMNPVFSVPFTETKRIHLRWMVQKDLSEVLRIDQSSQKSSWSADEFLRTLRRRNRVGMVAEHQGQIVGYMVYELTKTRIGLLRLGTLASERWSGVGRRMVEKLIGKLSGQRRCRITCEVHERNLPAQLFFQSLGFRATDVFRGEIDSFQNDSYLFQYRLKVKDEIVIPRWFKIGNGR